MSSGGQTPVTQQTQQTRDPWSAAQPHLTTIMNSADQVFSGTGPYSNIAGNTGGYTPYTGQTVATADPYMNASLAWQTALGLQDASGTAGINAARGLGTSLIDMQGLTPGLQASAGAMSNIGGAYNQQLAEASGAENPFLQSMLDTSNRRIGDRINSSMSGAGRYGSGQHTDTMARALAESADPILAQDYARRQQEKLASLQGMQQAYGAQGDIYGQGLQRAGQWAQLMPSLDEARYSGAQKLGAVGQYNQERAQKELEDQIKLYNAQQAYPWEQLARYNALIGGAGALGGTTVGSTTTPINSPSTLQKVLGGGAAGAGIGGSFGGPVGGAVGAGVGGLLGLL
jgi:hypothetical protein